jgi:hypothetical protein
MSGGLAGRSYVGGVSDQEGQSSARDSAVHVMVFSVLLAVPALKLAWTLGSGAAARQVLDVTSPGNWLDIVSGMFLYEPLLATVLAVVASRFTYAYFARRGGAAAWQDTSRATKAAQAAIVPAALAVAVGSFYGPWWGVACGVLGYLMRLGVILEYATGRRQAATGKRTGTRAETPAQRAADAVRITALALGLVVLPVVSVVAALDGRSWSNVVRCDVNTGTTPHRARLIELERQAEGVVGWDIDQAEVANGTNCATDDDSVIRAPLWRD